MKRLNYAELEMPNAASEQAAADQEQEVTCPVCHGTGKVPKSNKTAGTWIKNPPSPLDEGDEKTS